MCTAWRSSASQVLGPGSGSAPHLQSMREKAMLGYWCIKQGKRERKTCWDGNWDPSLKGQETNGSALPPAGQTSPAPWALLLNWKRRKRRQEGTPQPPSTLLHRPAGRELGHQPRERVPGRPCSRETADRHHGPSSTLRVLLLTLRCAESLSLKQHRLHPFKNNYCSVVGFLALC